MAKVEKTIRRLVSKNAALLFFLIWLLLWIKPKIQVLYPNQFHWMYRIDSIILLGLSWVLMSLVFIAPGFSIWIATIERIETIRKRRSDYRCVVSAAIAGISPAIAAFWLRIGVPPTSDPLLWGISIFFLVESAGIILVLWACVRLREFAHQLSWSRKVIGLFGLILVNCSFFFLPLIWTVLTARFASQFLSANKYEDVEVVEKEPVVLTHISDLHITNETLTKDGKQPGNRRLPTLLQKINALKPRYLVLSGDLTDEGKPDQWATLGGILEWNLSPGVRIVIAPGNHDLNRFFGADPSIENIDDKQAEITTDFSKIPRLARMVTFQSKYLPEMTNRDGIRLDALIRNIPRKSSLAGLQAEISKCADGCKNRSFPVETPEQQFAAETACEL